MNLTWKAKLSWYCLSVVICFTGMFGTVSMASFTSGWKTKKLINGIILLCMAVGGWIGWSLLPMLFGVY